MGISQRNSPRMYYVNVKVLSFQEIMRMKIIGLFSRVKSSSNVIVDRVANSDVFYMSSLFRKNVRKLLKR